MSMVSAFPPTCILAVRQQLSAHLYICSEPKQSLHSGNMSGLRLDMSMGRDGFDSMEATYRNEGLSVGSDHMRLYGEEIKLDVCFDDLILGDRIGQGACSSVNVARHRRTGENYAIKMFNVHDKGQASQLYNEILLLTNFQCDALISLKGAFHDEGSIGVIIEYMDRGSIEFMMNRNIDVSESVMAAVAFQMLWGLGYLHYEKQIHRDVKPGNVLMNSLGQVKLSDFGISKELDNSVAMSNTSVGSYRYMSPERLRGEKYDAAGDVWSVGISIIELWSKKYPFSHVADTPISLLGELERFDFNRILGKSTNTTAGNSSGNNNVSYSRYMRGFLLSTLALEPNDRQTSGDLVQSMWFEDCCVSNLVDAQQTVANWLRSINRSNNNSNNNNNLRKQPNHHANTGAAGRPPRRDNNEMSISMESSRSSVASHNTMDDSMAASRDRMQLSNNPFTSSGNLNSSFNGSSGGISASGVAAAAGIGSTAANNLTSAAMRYRSQYDNCKPLAEENSDDDEYEADFDDDGEGVGGGVVQYDTAAAREQLQQQQREKRILQQQRDQQRYYHNSGGYDEKHEEESKHHSRYRK